MMYAPIILTHIHIHIHIQIHTYTHTHIYIYIYLGHGAKLVGFGIVLRDSYAHLEVVLVGVCGLSIITLSKRQEKIEEGKKCLKHREVQDG